MAETKTVKIEISEDMWVDFRQLALEKRLSTQALLGACVCKYVIAQKKEGKK